MKRFITMILAIAMVITSVVVPMNKVSAAEVNNKSSWNSMVDNEKPDKHEDWDYKVKATYAKISYDKKGNLVAKVKIKNFNKNKIKYTVRKNVEIRFKWELWDGDDLHEKYKVYRINKKGIAKRFNLKSGQSKTITVKIPKSKIKGKYYNLREVDTTIEWSDSIGYYNKTGKYTIRGSCGSNSADIDNAKYQEDLAKGNVLTVYSK